MQSRAIFYEEVSQCWRQWQQPQSMYPLFIINYSNLPFLFLFTKLMVDFPRKSCLSCTSGGESLVLINFPGRWGYSEGDESETNTHTHKNMSSAAAGKLLHLRNKSESPTFTALLLFVEEARAKHWMRSRAGCCCFIFFHSCLCKADACFFFEVFCQHSFLNGNLRHFLLALCHQHFSSLFSYFGQHCSVWGENGLIWVLVGEAKTKTPTTNLALWCILGNLKLSQQLSHIATSSFFSPPPGAYCTSLGSPGEHLLYIS